MNVNEMKVSEDIVGRANQIYIQSAFFIHHINHHGAVQTPDVPPPVLQTRPPLLLLSLQPPGQPGRQVSVPAGPRPQGTEPWCL